MGGRGGSSGTGGGYKTFADRARGTHEYHGNGQEQVNFFRNNSNSDALISAMSNEDRYAFQAWSNGYFMDGAQYGGWDNNK